MNKEKSCGAVLYKKVNNNFEFLLIQQTAGHWSFPKGHVEGNETEIETTCREILEETGLSATIDSNFRKVITFSPKKNVMKDVVYFVGEVNMGSLKVQESEVQKAVWLNIDEARSIITYDNTKEVFEAAIVYLERLK